MAAVPLRVLSAHTTSDRRVSPDWTVAQLKARLEPITGVPIEHQRLVLHGEDLHVEDEEGTLLGSLGLVPQSELQVRHIVRLAIRPLCPSHTLLHFSLPAARRLTSPRLLHSPDLMGDAKSRRESVGKCHNASIGRPAVAPRTAFCCALALFAAVSGHETSLTALWLDQKPPFCRTGRPRRTQRAE